MSGIVTAGTHSGCGKTTVTLGLMAALIKKGLKVQPFKTGPDFIDTGLHGLVTGRVSRNLDLWMCGEDYVKGCFAKHSGSAGISVVEGVMGLYDGNLSTAALARCLSIPVVLVVDAYGMAETAGALVKGMREAGPELSFAGVVFNRVSSENHYKRLTESVKDMPVLGRLPRDHSFEIPHRHLGLTTAEDNPITQGNIERLADAVLACIDLEKIIQAAHNHRDTPLPLAARRSSSVKEDLNRVPGKKRVRIAVARDKAFCFYYEDNLDLLREAGADLVFFSPLADAVLPPDIDGIYIGGGYPELHAEQLSLNKPMQEAIKGWAESNRPIYAECGGLMYLSKGIWKTEADRYEMTGVFPFDTIMKKTRARLGYREIRLGGDCIPGSGNAVARGHEFHYSEIVEDSAAYPARLFSVTDGSGNMLPAEGFSYKKTLAGYIHLHFGSNPALAKTFINYCKEQR